MCDVDKRIEQWRGDLAGAGTLSDSDIDELEAHLREEIEHLRRRDLSEAEAFLVARHRLGDAAELDNEFAKVNRGWRSLQRFSWMALGVLLYLLVNYVATGISQGVVVAAAWSGLRGYELGILGVAVKAVAAACLLLLAWVGFQRWDRAALARRLRQASMTRLVLLFVTLGVVDCVLIGSQLVFRGMTARTVGAAEFGHATIASACAGLVWTILAPLMAAGLVMALWVCAERRREACLADPSGR